jgi:hypothetical protein
MNMLNAFIELDKLAESKTIKESSEDILNRVEIIERLESLGKYYDFDRFSTPQLWRMLEKAEVAKEKQDALKKYHKTKSMRSTCNTCGHELTDGGYCPSCDDGDDLFNESLDFFEIGNHITDHYIFPSAKAKYDCILDIKSRYSIHDTIDQDDLDTTAAKFGGKLTENKKALVESFDDTMLEIDGFTYHIVDTFSDDGYEGHEVVYAKNGIDIVSVEVWEDGNYVTVIDNLYANNLMQRNYDTFSQFADDLEYKTSRYVENLKVNKNKENYEMNFQTILEELDKLYEEDQQVKAQDKTADQAKSEQEVNLKKAKTEGCKKTLKETVGGADLPETAYVLASQDDQGAGFLNATDSSYEDCICAYSIGELDEFGYFTSKDEAIAAAKIFYNLAIRGWEGTISVELVHNFRDAYLNNATPDCTQVYAISDVAQLTEAAKEEEILIDDEPVVNDEAEAEDESAIEDVPGQLILECENCGGLVIKAEADVAIDEETGLADMDEACQYCEEAKGYKILGKVAPYEEDVIDIEDDEVIEEGIFDKFKSNKNNKAQAQLANKNEPEKSAESSETAPEQKEAFTTYTYDEWIQGVEAAHSLYSEFGKDAYKNPLWSKAMEIAACENLYKDLAAYMDAYMSHKGSGNFPHKSFAKHLKEGIFDKSKKNDIKKTWKEVSVTDIKEGDTVEINGASAAVEKAESDKGTAQDTVLLTVKLDGKDRAKRYKNTDKVKKLSEGIEDEESEELNELFGFGKKNKAKGTDTKNTDNKKEYDVTISIYNENGTKQFSQVFKELPGKMRAEDQFNEIIKSNGLLSRYKSSDKKYDWSYERKSNPASPFDTDKYFNAASKIIRD